MSQNSRERKDAASPPQDRPAGRSAGMFSKIPRNVRNLIAAIGAVGIMDGVSPDFAHAQLPVEPQDDDRPEAVLSIETTPSPIAEQIKSMHESISTTLEPQETPAPPPAPIPETPAPQPTPTPVPQTPSAEVTPSAGPNEGAPGGGKKGLIAAGLAAAALGTAGFFALRKKNPSSAPAARTAPASPPSPAIILPELPPPPREWIEPPVQPPEDDFPPFRPRFEPEEDDFRQPLPVDEEPQFEIPLRRDEPRREEPPIRLTPDQPPESASDTKPLKIVRPGQTLPPTQTISSPRPAASPAASEQGGGASSQKPLKIVRPPKKP